MRADTVLVPEQLPALGLLQQAAAAGGAAGALGAAAEEAASGRAAGALGAAAGEAAGVGEAAGPVIRILNN